MSDPLPTTFEAATAELARIREEHQQLRQGMLGRRITMAEYRVHLRQFKPRQQALAMVVARLRPAEVEDRDDGWRGLGRVKISD